MDRTQIELSDFFTHLKEIGHEDFSEFVIRKNVCEEGEIDFEVETAKHLWQPDKKIAKMSREKIQKKCWKRYQKEWNHDFDWNDDNKAAVFKIADRSTELLNYMYDEAFWLQKIFNEEFKKGNKIFQDYKIEGKLKYHNHNAFGKTNKRTAHFLCEAANLDPAIHGILILNDTVDSEDERDRQLFISCKPNLLNWNIEIFDKKWVGNHPINYFMHSLFADGGIYTLNDLVCMNPDDWQPQFYLRFVKPESLLFPLLSMSCSGSLCD